MWSLITQKTCQEDTSQKYCFQMRYKCVCILPSCQNIEKNFIITYWYQNNDLLFCLNTTSNGTLENQSNSAIRQGSPTSRMIEVYTPFRMTKVSPHPSFRVTKVFPLSRMTKVFQCHSEWPKYSPLPSSEYNQRISPLPHL